MAIKNSVSSYGTIAKWLHWGTALLFLAAYVSVYYRHWFTEKSTPENWTAIQIHLSVGITVAVIVVLRILWRINNQTPTLEPGSKVEHLAAHLGHYALYAVMIIMPITGYIGTGINTEYFFMFDIPKFESTQLYQSMVIEGMGLTPDEFEEPVDFLHKKILGEWLVWMLIVGHAGAALFHHFVRKDKTLQKMTVMK